MKLPALFLGILALAILAPSVAVAAQLKVAVHLPFLSPAYPDIPYIVDALKLLEPDLQAIDRSHTFRVTYTSTNGSLFDSSNGFLAAAIKDGTLGVVGDFDSDLTLPQALEAGYFNIPMCSGSASTSQLSSLDYPNFYRTIVSDPQQGQIIARFIKYMGWSRVNLVFATGTYGQSISQGFLAAASSLGISVTTVQSFSPSSDQLGPQLDAIDLTGTLINVIAALPEESVVFLKAAQARGLVGPGNTWVAPDAFSTALTAAADKTWASLLDGFLFVMPLEDSGNDLSASFKARWKAVYPSVAIPSYALLFADCLLSMGNGLVKMVNRFGADRVLARNYTFDPVEFVGSFKGLSGDFVVDKKGDRLQPLIIRNIFNGAVTTAYTIDAAQQVTKLVDPTFASGTKSIPADRITQALLVPTWTSVGGILLAVATIAMIVAILVTDAYLFIHRSVPHVRHLSYPFLNFICIGCIVLLSSTLLSIGIPSSQQCQASLWIFAYGFEMVVGATVAKAYRIWTIFENKSLVKVTRVSDRALFQGVGAIMLAQSVILLVWSIVDAPKPQMTSARTYIYYACRSESPTFQNALTATSIAFNALLTLVFLYLAFKTRNVSSSYNESKFMYLAGQTIALSSIVITAFALFDFGAAQIAAFYVKHYMILFAVGFTFFALVGRLVIDVRAAARKQDAPGGAPATTPSGQASTGKLPSVPSNPNWAAKSVISVKTTGMLSQWRAYKVQVFALDGQITFVPDKSGVAMGFVLDLTATLIDPAPVSQPRCVELFAQGKSWLLQFESDKERGKWAELLTSIATTTGSSRGRKNGSSNLLSSSGHDSEALSFATIGSVARM
ncbi:hypothetical protein H9P43_006661 [Blastocladiella emersonii ATCC 22665]|nr:hypothetical protein H9P43_006661 [Blastocladiella emersonii ATCC 22665]